MAFEFIQEKLIAQKKQSRYRQRVCTHPVDKVKVSTTKACGAHITVDGKTYLNFSSNDYLGLNNHPKINQAMQIGLDKFGLCSSSSSLVTGFHYAHQALEDKICQWLNKPKCLLFSSGFTANEAIFSSLGQDTNSHFFLDKLSHASMIDGAFTSKAKVKRFAHNNITQLDQQLTQSNTKNKLIASEGVFSMDGDQALLKPLARLAEKHNAWLYLDDAHSMGVIGKQGQGSLSVLTDSNELKTTTQQTIIMATLGKAIATSGAFLACDEALHDYLINFARHYIYSTAMSPAIAWASIKSIELIQQEQWRRDKIIELSQLLHKNLNDNINIVASNSSIHAIIIGDEKKALKVSEQLKKQGIWLTAIRPPTVAVGTSRLRVTICASHNVNDINHLTHCLTKALL